MRYQMEIFKVDKSPASNDTRLAEFDLSRDEAIRSLGEGNAIWDRLDAGTEKVITRVDHYRNHMILATVWRVKTA